MGGGGAAPGPGARGTALAVAEEYAGENAGANAGANAGGRGHARRRTLRRFWVHATHRRAGRSAGRLHRPRRGGRCGAPPPIVGGRPASGGPDPSIARARSAI